MKTVVQPYDEEVDVTVLEVDMPEPELLEQKTGSPEVTPEDWEKVKPIYTDFMQSYTSIPGTAGGCNGWVESCRNICRRNLRKRSIR